MAVHTASQRTPESVEQTRETWQRRIRQAQEAQRRFHGIWATNLAFAAGQHFLVWDERSRQLRSIRDFDSRYDGRELYTADRITELRAAQLGELTSEDERPELQAAQSGTDSEEGAETLNRLVDYAWEHEWQSDAALLKARRLVLDLGVAAIRCLWDPNEGAQTGLAVIGADGQPVRDHQALTALQQDGALPDGSLPTYKPVRQGRTRWEVYSAFQILTPPGVVHEDDFPWEALMRPVLVDDVKDTYGVAVREDTDIANGIGMPQTSSAAAGQGQSRLRDHCWLFPCFDRPTTKHPLGRTLYFGGSNLELLDVQDGLPYKLGDKPHTGITYMHWWRLSDRFNSRSFIEGCKDPQRVISRRKTQNVEIFDRGIPRAFVREGDYPGDTTGAPLEIVELSRTANPPQIMPGITPSPAMYQDIASLDEDLAHASTISPLRLGENPENVQTYGQLAMLNDNEHGKRQTIQVEHNQVKATLVELSISDIKKYWPESKQALIVGDDDRIQQATFQKSQIPEQFRVKVPKGAPLPKTQGAEVKKIDAIWEAMVQSGFAAGDPASATNWYRDSLEAGQAIDLPKASPSSQQQIAHLENLQMRQGEEVMPAYYDQLPQHIPVHREVEDQARAAGDVELASRVERHIQAHLQVAQAVNAAVGPQAQPGAPGAPTAGLPAGPPDPSQAPPGPPPGAPTQ